jgi:3-methyladenine DNA glycosylase/8-oxoguanine DNA glycosylase
MTTIVIETNGPIDLGATFGNHLRGNGDPTMRLEPNGVWRAVRTPDGPVTVHLATLAADRLMVDAWGPGAPWALSRARAFSGAGDDPAALRPVHELVAQLARRSRGTRLARSGLVWDALLPAILEQKVTGTEAHRAFRLLAFAFGEAAPGRVPPSGPLRVAPSAETIAGLPYHAFHPFGIERRRADTLRRAAAVVARLEPLVGRPYPEAEARLRAIPGVGPWTAAEVAARAWGDPDAVSVGDFHLPNLVAWALAGEPRADDARMLELLEPYRGQRGRVVRLLELSGIRPPAYGPRLAPRRIEAL